MKTIKSVAAIFLVTAASLCTKTVQSAPPFTAVSFQVFYDNLAPYGSWVSYPGYGYAWIPAQAGFVPYYSSGHWAYTGDGWMWISNYPWGWAPFHYGTWEYDPFYGWLWIPGYYWAPAWVTWGYFDGYYGWAPIGPHFSFSAFHYPHINHWCFVHPRYLTSVQWVNYAYRPRNNRIYIGNNSITNVKNITVVKNVSRYNDHIYYAGPGRGDVERTGKTAVNPLTVKETGKPGKTEAGGEAINIYRPKISQDNKTAKPAQLVPLKNVKAERAEQNRVNATPQPSQPPVETEHRQPAKEVEPVPQKDVYHTQQRKPPHQNEIQRVEPPQAPEYKHKQQDHKPPR